MNAYIDTMDSPAGGLSFAVNEEGELIRLSFLDGKHSRTMEEELVDEGYTLVQDDDRTVPVRDQIIEYNQGKRTLFDLPLALGGTEWQETVWHALTEIPFGETRSYGQIASAVGRSGAARAVGRANGTNPVPLVVPCHRVIGADGTLTGFGGGLHLKSRLLDHEAGISQGGA
jgi:methylated-DNA-[protein]-cysteine S-methyltransferase